MIRRLLINRDNEEQTALIQRDQAISYRKLTQKALSLKPLLPRTQGKIVAIFLPDGGDYIAALWGVLASGGVAFPLNTLMTRHEVYPLLQHAAVRTVITSTSCRSFFDAMDAPPPHVLSIDAMEPRTGAFEVPDIPAENPMLLLATSGTTGTSKMVLLSERNVEASLLGYLDKMRLDEPDARHARFLLSAPFCSIYGNMVLTACLAKSLPLVLLDGAFTLGALYRTAEKHRVTHYEGSGSTILLMEKMAGRPIPYDIRTLRYFGFGGSKVSGSTIEKVQSAYEGVELHQGYGMTEASPLIAKHPQAKVKKVESVGTAIRGLEIAIDTENGITHTPFVEGEIIVKGPSVMLGYYRDEAETKRALRDGYLHTGDIGYLDEEGYLYICGRKKNIIIVRGFTVYPEEVEAQLRKCPLVLNCLVYGKADAAGGEAVCADIVPALEGVQAGAIAQFCASHLAGYKRPTYITFRNAIPQTQSGKASRRKEEAHAPDL